MAKQITWALGILGGANNSTFPINSIGLTHQRFEYYFDVKFVQVSRNPQLWYYMSNLAVPSNWFLFYRSGNPRGIHIPPGFNFGGQAGLKSCITGLMHEIGHYWGGSSHNPKAVDGSRQTEMYAYLQSGAQWTPSDMRWYSWLPAKKGIPRPWEPGEVERWNTSFAASEFDSKTSECHVDKYTTTWKEWSSRPSITRITFL